MRRPAHRARRGGGDADASPRGPVTFALWEPPLTALRGAAGAPVRRTATAEAARLLADLVTEDMTTVAFVRSRRAAEAVAMGARRALAETGAAGLAARVAAYRSGYLPEDRRAAGGGAAHRPAGGLAATTALELGVNITRPGRGAHRRLAGHPRVAVAAGRAGRAGPAADALAVLIARDDPLDTYLVHHPEAVFGRPVEATVLDPDNPYVLAPHLCAAAAELPLTDGRPRAVRRQGRRRSPTSSPAQGLLRPRGAGWYLPGAGRALTRAGLRGSGGPPVQIVEATTGRLVGTVDEPSAHVAGAHRRRLPAPGQTFLVRTLDLADGVALVERGRSRLLDLGAGADRDRGRPRELLRSGWGEASVHFGDVQVTRQVTSFLPAAPRYRAAAGEQPLDLPAAHAADQGRMVDDLAAASGPSWPALGVDLAGAAHAAEHASIGLLPLVATLRPMGHRRASPPTCTRRPGWLTVFVYDGHHGGAGFAERGFHAAREWLQATARAIESCELRGRLPSCIQSPKCGNGNEPLSKTGAVRLLSTLLAGAAPPARHPAPRKPRRRRTPPRTSRNGTSPSDRVDRPPRINHQRRRLGPAGTAQAHRPGLPPATGWG